ncbi:MAG: 3'-5' exonuclease, partial [Candidatus Izemoplasma sp.]
RVKINEISFNELVDYILETSGYLNALKNDEKGDVRYENLLEFKTMLSENDVIYGELSKEDALVYLLEDISLKVNESNEEVEDGVSFMTLHSAKGLEFRVVFLVTLENGMFPLGRAFESIKDFEEERRLMYVGVTRAKEQLFLTNAKNRQTYGEVLSNPDSAFIKEIDPALISVRGYDQYINKPFAKPLSSSSRRLSQKKKKNIDNYKENDINKGDKINHTSFGDGLVVSVVGDTCTIAFKAPHGIKKLLKNHNAIKKI